MSDHEAEAPVKPTEEVVQDLSRPDVTMKYRAASDITNLALEHVLKLCVPDADIHDICKAGDAFIEEKCSTIYNKKNKDGELPKKGVAFPTCLSVNEICGHFAPMKGESQKLKIGDICKVDIGCHIDGFITVGAHTIVVVSADGHVTSEGVADPCILTGRKADVMMAAWTAMEAALRTVKIGNKNKEVTEVMNKAVSQFNCNVIRGVLSHEVKQHVIDGSRVIISKETAEDKVDTFTFGANEVYHIDVYATTGDGKTKETELRTTIYKRDPEVNYKLKTNIGRKFVHEVSTRYPFLPFTTCAFEDETMARAGVSECLRHGLVTPYPVLSDKQGETIAQFAFTVLLLPGGSKKVTGLPFTQKSIIKSECCVTDESLKELLARPLNPSKPKKPKAVDEVKADAVAA